MDTVFRIIEIAVIPVFATAVGAWALIRANRKEIQGLDSRNTEQHNDNAVLLNHLSRQIGGIDGKVDRLDDRLDSVQGWQFEHEKSHLTDRDKANI